jgi:hypothetical protein
MGTGIPFKIFLCEKMGGNEEENEKEKKIPDNEGT